jgi:hypothetical protein
MSKRIAYIFASRERPNKFFDCLNNIQDMSGSDNYFVYAKLDFDDPFIEQYKEKISEYPELIVVFGYSNGKIHAINRGLEDLPECDIVCCHSDDMKFIEFGFDEIIREHCGSDDYVHFPDGHANERLCTYSIMGRKYFDLFWYIYNPEYSSVYADNEQFDVAKILGKYKYVNKHILRHEHPAWGYGIADDLLKRTEDSSVYKKDHETYLRRKLINFGI